MQQVRCQIFVVMVCCLKRFILVFPQVTIQGAESPRAEDREEDVKKEQLIIQEERYGEEKKDEEKTVLSDGEQPAEVTVVRSWVRLN